MARLGNVIEDLHAELGAVSHAAKEQQVSLQGEVESKDSENMDLHQRMMQERARTATLEDKIRYLLCLFVLCACVGL